MSFYKISERFYVNVIRPLIIEPTADAIVRKKYFDHDIKVPFVPDAVIVRKVFSTGHRTLICHVTCEELINSEAALAVFSNNGSETMDLIFPLDGSEVNQSYRFNYYCNGESAFIDDGLHLLLEFVRYQD